MFRLTIYFLITFHWRFGSGKRFWNICQVLSLAPLPRCGRAGCGSKVITHTYLLRALRLHRLIQHLNWSNWRRFANWILSSIVCFLCLKIQKSFLISLLDTPASREEKNDYSYCHRKLDTYPFLNGFNTEKNKLHLQSFQTWNRSSFERKTNMEFFWYDVSQLFTWVWSSTIFVETWTLSFYFYVILELYEMGFYTFVWLNLQSLAKNFL